MAIEDYYTSLTLKKLSESVNAFGQPIKSFTDSTFSGVINKYNQYKEITAEKQTVRVTHKLFCNTDVNINYGDMVVYDSQNYRVVDTPKNTVNRDHHYKIYLEYIENVD